MIVNQDSECSQSLTDWSLVRDTPLLNPRDGDTDQQHIQKQNIPEEAITINITKTIRLLHIVGGDLIRDTIAHN